MNPIPNPHDRLFKEIWSEKETAASFLDNYLPADILAKMDMNTLEIQKDSFVQPDLAEYFSDILYGVTLENSRAYVYLLLEHKSYKDTRVAFQIFGYLHSIWSLHIKQHGMPLPVIVPMLIYHGEESLDLQGQFSELFKYDMAFRRYIPDFAYQIYDLSDYSEEEIKGGVLLRIVMLLFKFTHRPDYLGQFQKIVRMMNELSDKKTGLQYLEILFKFIICTTGDITIQELKKIVEENLSAEKGELIMTLGEQLINQGIQQGKLEGKLEAVELGLKLKFGPSGLKLMDAICQIKDITRLDTIVKAIETAKNVSDIRKMVLQQPV